jgi:hypothetical protein
MGSFCGGRHTGGRRDGVNDWHAGSTCVAWNTFDHTADISTALTLPFGDAHERHAIGAQRGDIPAGQGEGGRKLILVILFCTFLIR